MLGMHRIYWIPPHKYEGHVIKINCVMSIYEYIILLSFYFGRSSCIIMKIVYLDVEFMYPALPHRCQLSIFIT